jgi:16S rRNA U516 pseudouridylate synthase RsuA-like enzyme
VVAAYGNQTDPLPAFSQSCLGRHANCTIDTTLFEGGYLDIKQMLREVEAEIAKLQRVADALRGTESSQTKSQQAQATE